MASLIVFASLILTVSVCAGLSVYLWPARHSSLHRLVMFTQMAYAAWAFFVLLTSFVPDFSHKVLFTEVRQLFLPALAPTWLLVGIGIFYRSLWERLGLRKYLIYAVPCVVIAGHACSVVGFGFAQGWTFQDFTASEGMFNLLKYKVGPLLRFNFSYVYLCIAILYLLYIWVIATGKGARRKYALLLAGAGVIHLAIEVSGRTVLGIPEIVQVSVAAIWPAAIALHYAVTKMELLDIGVLAYEKVFESLQSPVLIFDSKDCFWNANKVAFSVLGLQPAMLGEDRRKIPVLASLFANDEFIEAQQKTYQILRHELKLKDGEETARFFVLNDVTDLQERNETLKDLNAQVLKMMKFNQKIHSVLSHDLTGSLVGVRMMVEGMKRRFETQNAAADAGEMGKLLRSNESSIELLRDVLAWGEERETSLGASLKSCIDEALSHLQAQVHAKNVRIQKNLPSENIHLRGSGKAVEAVFRNILSNAIKFSHSGGEVVVKASLQGSFVLIEFVDEGVGISEEKIAMILSGRSSEDVSSAGFGLGLRFTLGFIEQLNGKIEIQSKVGKGSCFALTLPLV